jgi:maleate isomerase
MRIVARSPTPLAFDAGPTARRLGLLALATDLTVELDAAAVTRELDVAVHVTRLAFTNPVTAASLEAMAPELAGAAARILPGERLDAVAFACTSASAAIGDDAVRTAITAERPDTPCATPTSGLVAAAAAAGVRKLAVLAPYGEAVTRDLAAYLERLGLEITALSWLDVDDDRAIARISPATIEAAAVAALDPGADALFCSCTALRARALAPALERRLAKPVFTSNQVLLWHALKSAGVGRPLGLSAYLP